MESSSTLTAMDDVVQQQLDENGETLLYESHSALSKDASGELQKTTLHEVGILDAHAYQRAARPWSYAGEDEIYVYAEWSRRADDGTVERGMRVTTQPNPNPCAPALTSGPPGVDPLLWEQAAEVVANGGGPNVFVLIKLRDFPDWDVPVVPPEGLLSAAEHDKALEDQAEAAAARQRLFQQRSAGVRDVVLGAGGSVGDGFWRVGWLSAWIPPDALQGLAQRGDIAALTSGKVEDGVGTMTQGATKFDLYTGVNDFYNQGYYGEADLTIAVVEPWALEDEACAFYDGPNCSGTSRIKQRYRCDDEDHDNKFCEPVTGYTEAEELLGYDPIQTPYPTTHGTLVAAAALGDYLDDQGNGKPLGDPSAVPPFYVHSFAWEWAATGMAPEASLVYLGIQNTASEASIAASYASGLNEATFHAQSEADILTSGWYMAIECRVPIIQSPPQAYQLVEEVAEFAFDEGVFLAILAGNNNGPAQSECNVVTPSDTPKVFTVSGADMSSAACAADYQDCNVDSSNSARGGADILVAGQSQPTPQAVSVVDLLAPQRVTHDTNDEGTSHGEVLDMTEVPGTSVAAPRLAGMAAVAKEYWVDQGATWPAVPGGLHAYMLAMGDRHRPWLFGQTAAWPSGTHPLYGLGRVKMRLPESFGVFGDDFRTKTFNTGSADYSYWVLDGILPSGSTFLKCVMNQAEDMSHKSDISDIDLHVEVREKVCHPIYGWCLCSTGGTLVTSGADTSEDTKKMVAVEGVTMTNRCARVTLDKQAVTSTHNITTHTYCYVADEVDDEPN